MIVLVSFSGEVQPEAVVRSQVRGCLRGAVRPVQEEEVPRGAVRAQGVQGQGWK